MYDKKKNNEIIIIIIVTGYRNKVFGTSLASLTRSKSVFYFCFLSENNGETVHI